MVANRFIRLCMLATCCIVPAQTFALSPPIFAPDPPKAAEAGHRRLLEDNGEALLKQLTNPTGDPGRGDLEKTVCFSGASSIRITPMQRFHPGIPGWKFPIRQNPKPGEYRYLRFAWKADGCKGIMIQFHDKRQWNLRYTAGIDQFNWGTKFVAAHPPTKWKMVTRDLFQDFGNRTLQGIALTAFGGRAAYFDHIYLARTVEDLDRIDATGPNSGKTTTLSDGQLERYWQQLADVDDSIGYLAFWRMVAAPKSVVPFLLKKLNPTSNKQNAAKIERWILDLDSNEFKIRWAASKQLFKHLDEATPLLEKATHHRSAEVRMRARLLLANRTDKEQRQQRLIKSIRALEYMPSASAHDCLRQLAERARDDKCARLARAALTRLSQRRKSPDLMDPAARRP